MARQNNTPPPTDEAPKKRRGAPPGNQFAKGNKGGGRKPKYTPDMLKVARAMGKMGALDHEIADELGIGVTTLNAYKAKYKEFSEAVKPSKAAANARVVGQLFKNATGYTYTTEKVVVVKGVPKVVKVSEFRPASDKAIQIWLQNRMRSEWGAAQPIEIVGKDGGPVQSEVTSTNLTATVELPTDPAQAAAMYKQLMEGEG